METGRDTDAMAVLQIAVGLAKTPEELTLVQEHITQVQQFQAARNQAAEANRRAVESVPGHGCRWAGLPAGTNEKC